MAQIWTKRKWTIFPPALSLELRSPSRTQLVFFMLYIEIKVKRTVHDFNVNGFCPPLYRAWVGQRSITPITEKPDVKKRPRAWLLACDEVQKYQARRNPEAKTRSSLGRPSPGKLSPGKLSPGKLSLSLPGRPPAEQNKTAEVWILKSSEILLNL